MYREKPASLPLLFCAFDGGVVAYDLTDGTTAWVHRPPVESDRSLTIRPGDLVVRGAVVYFMTVLPRKTGVFTELSIVQVTALDAANGSRLWSRSSEHEDFEAATMLVTDAHVVLASQGTLFCLAADSGEVLWTREPEQRPKGHPPVRVTLANEGATSYPVTRSAAIVRT